MATLVLAGAASWSQTTTTAAAAPPAAPPPSAFQEWVKQTKNPTDWLTWGGDLRVRDEYYNNSVTLTDTDPLHEQNVIRMRARVWASAVPVTDVSINARLSAEPKEWTRPSFASTFGGQQGMEWRYGILDNANVKWTNMFNQPLGLTAGRQDIAFGDFWDWWLVADGTPGDGSWTFFFDSVRLSYEAKDIKTKFDLVYIYQNAPPDELIPTIDQPHNGTDILASPREYYLTEQNEQGVIAYLSTKAIPRTTLDGYFMYKRDDREFDRLFPPFFGDNANIYTIGGRITGTPGDHWQYLAEGAYQFGNKEDFINDGQGNADRDLDAFGGRGRLTYLFKDQVNNQVSLVGEYLSGDDPSTDGKDEMFDVLWGRWPRWSELYIYSYIYETRYKIAQMNNLGRVGVNWSMTPMKGMTFSAMYNALFAPQEIPTRAVYPVGPAAGARFSGDGNFRGHYLQAVLKHQFSKQISAHLWTEFVWEGDYYNQRDTMVFLRPEILFTF